ncbi:MAG: DUF1847 domain-containing protein [Ichthyobacteriaceae bacterium]|nr:DUF1847 domain-containing protein [Ichthyobacteriaceae bacterium]
MNKLYDKKFRKIMQVNYDYTSMSANRIEEIRNFARGADFKSIGIAYCITFSHEAEVLKNYLSKDFNVHLVHCKYGRIPVKDIIGGTARRVSCNPAGQAEFLNDKDTELNISMGLCVGHDMIFSKVSEGLVTNLFDKDFTNNNNIETAINEVERELY